MSDGGEISARPTTALTLMSSTGRPPGVSLNRQVVLDEDEYTSALSSIIKRDFFPNLPRLAATNAYLSALDSEDPAAVSSSLRELSSLSERTPRERKWGDEQRELGGTPYVSRTPFGGEGLETPMVSARKGWEDDEVGGERGVDVKRRKIDTEKGLDDFQHSYTSEDNASFIEILHEENRSRKEKYAWAYDAERAAKSSRLRLEQGRRRGLIEAGGYVPNDGVMEMKRVEAGKRVLTIKGVAGREKEEESVEGGKGQGKDKGKEGDVLALEDPSSKSDTEASHTADSQALVTTHDVADPATTTTALIRHAPPTATLSPSQTQLVIPNSLPTASPTRTPSPTSDLREVPLSPASHLYRALYEAGLPETAIVTRGGEVVPVREVASGTGGEVIMRGKEVEERREQVERKVMQEEKDEREKVVPGWGYRARNSLYFGPDADVSPLLPVSIAPPTNPNELRQAPREIKHANTRLPDEDDDEDVGRKAGGGSSRRGTSPSRSAVGAAISGTPYHPSRQLPKYNNSPLVAAVPSPSPEQLGPQAVSQLMTWGTLLSTPRPLDDPSASVDHTPNAFKISEPKRRDAIGRRLAGDASRAMRERARGFGTAPRGLAVLSSDRTSSSSGRLGSMGPPRTPSSGFSSTPRRTAESLTPAGRDLLRRTAVTPVSASRSSSSLGLASSAGSRSRGDAMERAGGWGDLGKSRVRRIPAERTWTPSPAPKRGQ